MNENHIIDIMQHTLYIVALLSGPPLACIVVVGLASQIIQTVTQLKDQSLAFIPKVVLTTILLVILIPWYISTVKGYFQFIFSYMDISSQ